MTEMEKPQVAAIDISLTVDLGVGRLLAFRTFIERDSNAAWINVLLDRMNQAADRQKAIYTIEEEETRLLTEEIRFRQFVDQLAAINDKHQRAAAEWVDSGRRGDYKLPPQEAQHKRDVEESFRIHAQTVEDRKKTIAKLKAKVGEKAA